MFTRRKKLWLTIVVGSIVLFAVIVVAMARTKKLKAHKGSAQQTASPD